MNNYTTTQKEQLTAHLRDRFIKGTVEGYELAITLIVLAIREQISEDDIEPILEKAMLGNKVGVTVALSKAYKLIEAGAVNSVLGGKDE